MDLEQVSQNAGILGGTCGQTAPKVLGQLTMNFFSLDSLDNLMVMILHVEMSIESNVQR